VEALFSDCTSQRVKPIDERTVELTVVSIRPPYKPEAQARGPAANDAALSPTDADSAAGGFIQSDDPLIQQMAAQVAEKETDPWKLACALETFVQRTVKNKNYSQAFATAADVARTLEGDCTEHALLLAAL